MAEFFSAFSLFFSLFFVPLHPFMGRKIVLMVLVALHSLVVCSQETANEKQARRIFNQAYNQVFGDQGA